MERKYIILIAGLIVAALSLLSFILPHPIAGIYASIMQPLALFLGFVLALKVASIYAKELKKSFIFLSLFLLLYMVANILILWEFLYSVLGSSTVFLVLLLQAIDYAMLIASCVYTLKVIEVKRMKPYGWIFLGLLLPLCVYIVIQGIPLLTATFSDSPSVAVSRMMVRIIDMSVVLMLLPVLLLYIQHLRAKAQESITFTFIMGGLIFTLLSTYIFELAGIPLDVLVTDYFQKGSALDVTYIFGYLTMAVGLYANMKYDEWGFRTIEKALG